MRSVLFKIPIDKIANQLLESLIRQHDLELAIGCFILFVIAMGILLAAVASLAALVIVPYIHFKNCILYIKSKLGGN